MTTIDATVDGKRVASVIVTTPQPTVPVAARPADVGLVELATQTIRGSIWFTGSGAPVNPGGQTGDMYLDVDSGNIYRWDGDSWVLQGVFAPATDTPAEILAKLITVDGSGSGLDADLLDGHDSPYFAIDADLDAMTMQVTNNTNSIASIQSEQIIQNNRLASIEGINTSQDSTIALKANIASPVFTGDPHAPTPLTSDNDTSIATTAHVQANIAVLKGTASTNMDTLGEIETYINTVLIPSINSKIGDAPFDGNAYGRKANFWVDVSEEAPQDGITYGRKNGAWVASIGGATIADVPPGPPLVQGQLFFESDTGALYVWYNDGTSSQWVMVSGTGSSQQTDYVRKTGDTMTGALTITAGGLTVRKPDGSNPAQITGATTAGSARWSMFLGYGAESSGNAGSDFYLQSYTDAGAFLANNIQITRSTGAATFSGALTVNGNTAVGGALTVGSNVTISGNSFLSTGATAVLAATGAGTVYLRPNGFANATGQTFIDTGGNVTVNGGINVGTFSATGATDGKQVLSTYLYSSRTGTVSVAHQFFYNANGAVGSISTNASATAYNTTSDERRKDFIGAYDPLKAIAIIRADPVRDFNWKVDGSYAVGWGAQTSYAISEDLASPPPEDDPDQPWGMDQGRRTPYLWAALAWALDKIDSMEARLAALEAR